MLIVSVDGLPFSGKTTVCNELNSYYKQKGLSVAIRSKGHLSGRTDRYMDAFFGALEDWDFECNDTLVAVVNYGFLSMQHDLKIFMSLPCFAENIDLMIVDRLFTGHYVTADYFGVAYTELERPPFEIREFILHCTYKEAHRRSKIRDNMHGKLTQYIMASEHVYSTFQSIYEKHALKRDCYLYDNEIYEAAGNIIKVLDREGLT